MLVFPPPAYVEVRHPAFCVHVLIWINIIIIWCTAPFKSEIIPLQILVMELVIQTGYGIASPLVDAWSCPSMHNYVGLLVVVNYVFSFELDIS